GPLDEPTEIPSWLNVLPNPKVLGPLLKEWVQFFLLLSFLDGEGGWGSYFLAQHSLLTLGRGRNKEVISDVRILVTLLTLIYSVLCVHQFSLATAAAFCGYGG